MKKANDNPKYKRGRMTPGARPVSEGTRIDIAKVIADFQASDNQGTFFTTSALWIVWEACFNLGPS